MLTFMCTNLCLLYSMTTISKNKFATPLLSRAPWCVPYPVEEWNKAVAEVKKLMVETNRTAAFYFLDPDGYLRGGLKPSIFLGNGNIIQGLEINTSNEEFEPVLLPTKALKQFISIAPVDNIPKGALAYTATKIPGDILVGKEWDGVTLTADANFILIVLPVGVTASPGKTHVEGLGASREVQDLLANEYGDDFGDWLRAMILATDHRVMIKQIIHAITSSPDLDIKNFLGGADAHARLDLLRPDQYPLLQLTPMNRLAHADRLNARRAMCGPYASTPTPTSTTPEMSADSTAPLLSQLVTAIGDKNERREQEKLNLGKTRNLGVFMAGIMSVKTGEIEKLTLPTATAGFLECLGEKTKEERATRLGQLLDSNNKQRVKTDTRGMHKNMTHHDPVMIKAIGMGDYAKKPVMDPTVKIGACSFRSWWPTTDATRTRLADEQQRQDAEEAVNETESNRGAKRTYIAPATITESLEGIRSALANHISDAEAMYDCTLPGGQPFAATFAKDLIDWSMEADTIDWFRMHNDDASRRETVLSVHETMENFLCDMTCAAEDFTTASLLKKGKAEDIPLTEYNNATTTCAEAIADLKKLVRRRKKCDTVSAMTFGTSQAQKKPRLAGPPAPTTAGATPRTNQKKGTKKQHVTPTTSDNSWGDSGWSEEAETYSASKRRVPTFDKETSKKKGAFICKPTFDCVLAPDLSKIYCAKFNTYGMYCDPASNCRKKHIPFFRWNADQKKEQYCYVVDNKENVRINARDKPKSLPDSVADLVQEPGIGM